MFGRLDQMLRTTERHKKNTFDRGGPVWPPRSNAKDDRSGECLGGAFAPLTKNSKRPQPTLKKSSCFFQKTQIYFNNWIVTLIDI